MPEGSSSKSKSFLRHRTRLTLLGLLVAASALTGYSFAAFTIGSFSNTFNQGGANLNPSPPTGVTFTSANAQLAASTSPASTGKCTSTDASTSSAPDPLSTTANNFCLPELYFRHRVPCCRYYRAGYNNLGCFSLC
jgi:hypothetical protein